MQFKSNMVKYLQDCVLNIDRRNVFASPDDDVLDCEGGLSLLVVVKQIDGGKNLDP